ncbi:MAG: cysteine desulfurase [Phycisphaerales bacterium]|nr:cysteine desulfurase [Phycisphaerales bacterium]
MIDLDANATTRPSPAVAAAVAEALADLWHNPSSTHRAGQAVRNRVELARRDAAALLGVAAKEVTFTSGGTEAAHLAIRGVLAAAPRRGSPPVAVSTRVEHGSIRDLLEDLHTTGAAEVRWAPIDSGGVVMVDRLAPLLQGAALASIQWVNNETGAIQPIGAVHAACRRAGVLLHCDATQWAGKEEVAERRSDEMPGAADGATTRRGGYAPSCRHPAAPPLPCDLLTFAPHKFHGPKGVGVLWTRAGVRLHPWVPGSQELGRRGGTENVPGILGAGVACREAREWLGRPGERERLGALRDHFERTIMGAVPGAVVNGPRLRLWNTTNIGFPGLEAEPLLLLLSERGVCASAGAACSSWSVEPSPVLLAMGVPEDLARGSLRFSLSRLTTAGEIDAAVAIVVGAARDLAKRSRPAPGAASP